jgi:ABC-type sugar transport system ATPase subunit
MVYQDLSLCGSLKVYENVFLGRYLTRPFLGGLLPVLDKRAMARKTAKILARLGLESVSAWEPASNLSGGERQAVSLSRCLLFSPRVILLDEPTASMAVWEQQKILGMIRALKDQGRSQIVVSHNLEEIFPVADRVTVLKEGRTVWTGEIKGMTAEDLARLMFLGKS